MLTDDSGRSTTPHEGSRTDSYGASTVARIWSEK